MQSVDSFHWLFFVYTRRRWSDKSKKVLLSVEWVAHYLVCVTTEAGSWTDEGGASFLRSANYCQWHQKPTTFFFSRELKQQQSHGLTRQHTLSGALTVSPKRACVADCCACSLSSAGVRSAPFPFSFFAFFFASLLSLYLGTTTWKAKDQSSCRQEAMKWRCITASAWIRAEAIHGLRQRFHDTQPKEHTLTTHAFFRVFFFSGAWSKALSLNTLKLFVELSLPNFEGFAPFSSRPELHPSPAPWLLAAAAAAAAAGCLLLLTLIVLTSAWCWGWPACATA